MDTPVHTAAENAMHLVRLNGKSGWRFVPNKNRLDTAASLVIKERQYRT